MAIDLGVTIKQLIDEINSLSVDTSKFLEKTTYEYNKELALGSNGKVYVGSFSMYDSNITIEVSSTTSTTYNGTIVIATQNVDGAGRGTYLVNVYGDATGTLSSAVKIEWVKASSRLFNIYLNLAGWSKNLIHIQAVGLTTAPTISMTATDSIPTTNLLTVNNALRNTFAKTSDIPTKTSQLTNDSGYLTSHQDISGKANLSGGNTFTGTQKFSSPDTGGYSINADGYVKGSWLQSGVRNKLSSVSDKICVFDNSGWIYYNTPAELALKGGAVKQVKVNGTTKSPDSTGLVDLGTISGGGGNSDSVLIEVSNITYWVDDGIPITGGNIKYIYYANINVRVLSGTLRAGDKIQLCEPKRVTMYNYVNGVQSNIRTKNRYKYIYQTKLSQSQVDEYNSSGKNIFTLNCQLISIIYDNNGMQGGAQGWIDSDYIISARSYTNSSYGKRKPFIVRIVRPFTKETGDGYWNKPISNKVSVLGSYITVNNNFRSYKQYRLMAL